MNLKYDFGGCSQKHWLWKKRLQLYPIFFLSIFFKLVFFKTQLNTVFAIQQTLKKCQFLSAIKIYKFVYEYHLWRPAWLPEYFNWSHNCILPLPSPSSHVRMPLYRQTHFCRPVSTHVKICKIISTSIDVNCIYSALCGTSHIQYVLFSIYHNHIMCAFIRP